MKLKKMMLYTAPVALAGFLYLGGATGVREVLAKTITTLTATVTHNKIDSTEYSRGDHYDNPTDFDENGYRYRLDVNGKTILDGVKTGRVYYDIYEIKTTSTETQTEVPDDVVISEKTVPDKDPEAEAKEKKKERYRKEAERLKEEALQKQREEEALAVQKAAEKLNSDLIEQINKAIEQALNSAAAGQGAVAVIKTDYFTCFTQGMLDILKAHPEVSYEIHYLYQGKHYVLTIPAGADLSSLESSDGYYGFRYLDSIFGGYEEK